MVVKLARLWFRFYSAAGHARARRYRCACGYESMHPNITGDSFLESHGLVWLSRSGSTRYLKPVHPKASQIRDHRLSGRFGHDLRRVARPVCDAKTALKCGNQPENGSNHGDVSDPLDLLWPTHYIETGNCLEPDRGSHKFPERRRIPLLRPKRKSQPEGRAYELRAERSAFLEAVIKWNRSPEALITAC